MLEKICTPALLYIAFSLTHVIIDTINGLYNTAMTKFLVMIVFTVLLNVLCQGGLGIVSWIIVFIPFIMMSIITAMILFSFGLSPSTGKLKKLDIDKTNKVDMPLKDEPEYQDDVDDEFEYIPQKTEIYTHAHVIGQERQQ